MGLKGSEPIVGDGSKRDPLGRVWMAHLGPLGVFGVAGGGWDEEFLAAAPSVVC